MEKDKKFRALAIAAICVAIVGVSVAYAALGAALDITGTATVNTANSWSVTASDLSCEASGYASFASESGAVKEKTFTASNSAIIWNATFVAPGDSVTCELTWTNGGSIDAAVTNLVKGIDGEAKDHFTYTVVMGSTDLTTAVPEKKYLAAQTNKKATFTVTFDAGHTLSGDALTSISGKTATFTAAFEFEQAADDVTYTEL